jgi:selenide, water dikinase
LAGIGRSPDKNLLVGPETADDAAVYRLRDDLALVETADIITPLVDDPFTFGRIAAANALSDVYAMGGTPLTALNLVFFPSCSMDMEILREILAGGQDMLLQAGVCLAGGHTVEDDELKYGLAVSGTVHPEMVVRNSTACPGDLLLLTKPLGTGFVSTGIKADMASDPVANEAIRWMTTLNRESASVMQECGPSACTDVTGFGLIGHAIEMARGAKVTIRLQPEKAPVIEGVQSLIRDGMVPAGCYRNRDHFSRFISSGKRSEDELIPLFDPQTSGGLLIALRPSAAERFLEISGERGCFSALIGEVVERRETLIELY